MEARVVARSMRAASHYYGGLYNVDEPSQGWHQPTDDKDTKRARKRVKHTSENPQIVTMVFDQHAATCPDPDSQEAVVIHDEATDQWDD